MKRIRRSQSSMGTHQGARVVETIPLDLQDWKARRPSIKGDFHGLSFSIGQSA
jgi:hypothetical protein